MTSQTTGTAAEEVAPGRLASSPEVAAVLAEHRSMLLGLAYRLLGSLDDAEDVLQEAYLRWLRADRSAVREPRRYLSRIVTHLALDQLKARKEATYVGTWLPQPVDLTQSGIGDRIEARESLALATLHLMERLTPPERAAYVLRTAFDVPYAEIAEILDRTVADCRQLHHRADAQLGRATPRFAPTPDEHRQLLDSFVAAAHHGDLDRLRRLLSAEATAWTDSGGRVKAARNPVYGAAKVARLFVGSYQRYGAGLRVTPVEVNGVPALLVERPTSRHVLVLDILDSRIVGLYVIANPVKLNHIIHSGLSGGHPETRPVG